MSFRPISISLSPNTERDDILLALKLLFQPWRWKKGRAIAELEEEFKKYLGVKYAISFNSGRSAFLAILECFDLKENNEVLLQAFTCNAAVNPILWARLRRDFGGQAGLKPVYVDVDENTFNIDIEDLKRKIGPQSKVVIVQHTFGLPAEMDEVLEICRQNNLILIEDCAHSLGAKYKGKKLGIFGKASFFSFSRDKVISSVYGGMAVTDDDKLAKKIKEYQERVGYPSYFWIKQQLLHPILMNWLILPTYSILGKYFLILFQWFRILSKAVHFKEKRGKKPNYFPKLLPNALAELALNQFKKLEKFNNHRKEIADFYYNELKEFYSFELPPNPGDRKQIFLRFTIKNKKAHLIPSGESVVNETKVEMSEAHRLIKKAWQKNLLIGDWYTLPIAPHDTKLDKMKYKIGDCPKVEKLTKETLNLPTHINISFRGAKKIIDFLKSWK